MDTLRITAKDVLELYLNFVEIAEQNGIDTRKYQLTEGSTTHGRAWRFNPNPTTAIYLGATPRESYQYLSGMITGVTL